MNNIFISIFFIFFIFTQSTFAGIIAEVSSFFNQDTQKRVIFFGDVHFDIEDVANAQWILWKSLVERISLSSLNKNHKILFIVEESDSPNIFTKLPKVLQAKQIPIKLCDVRSIFAHVLEKLENKISNLPSIKNIFCTLEEPLVCVKSNSYLANVLSKEISNVDRIFQDFKQESESILKEIIQEDYPSSLDLVKNSPCDKLASLLNDTEHEFACNIIQEFAQNYIIYYSSEPETVDIFDINSLLTINDAQDGSVLVHVAGISHKKRLESMLLKTGFVQEVSFANEDLSEVLNEINKELAARVTEHFGTNPSAELLSDICCFHNQIASSVIYPFIDKIAVNPEAFEVLDTHFN
jgi:hypothetical protein